MEIFRMTAREVLVSVAGHDHDLHTACWKSATHRGTLKLTCSCGAKFDIAATKENTDALRNVSFEKS